MEAKDLLNQIDDYLFTYPTELAAKGSATVATGAASATMTAQDAPQDGPN
jgi:translocator protein